MRPVPIQPMQTPPEDRGRARRRGHALSAAQWLKQLMVGQEEAVTSLGELLLPLLLGAMEACWVDAALIGLANVGLLNFSSTLLPLWAPFVYIIGFQWILVLRERRSSRASAVTESSHSKDGKVAIAIPDAPLLIIMLAVCSLFIIWLQLYAPSKPIYDLTWLATLGSDILFLNIHFYQAFFILACSCYLCWRGLRLLSRSVEPSQVIRVLLLGLGVMIAAILLRAALQSAGSMVRDTVALFLLIPAFLFFALAAHALARIVFVRKSHFSGLEGSVALQERAVLTVIGSLGALLLLATVLVGLFASPAFFSDALRVLAPVGTAIGAAYGWLVGIFADVVVFLVTPIFWLISLLTSLLPHTKATPQNPPNRFPNQKPAFHPATITVAWLPFLRVALLVLLLLALAALVWWAVRRRRRRPVRLLRKDGDVHESLWSWLLLWHQLKGILGALFIRLFSRGARGRSQDEEDDALHAGMEGRAGDPAARDIRGIYRALLKKAASRGYTRRRDETPVEFRERLDEHVPLLEPQLETITEAYSSVRYGGSLPGPDEVAFVQGQWHALDQKWV